MRKIGTLLAVARATTLLEGHHSWGGKQAWHTTASSCDSGIPALHAHVINFAVSATTSLAYIITLLTRLAERFEDFLAQQTPPTGDSAKAAETGQGVANMVPLDFVNELLDCTLAGGRSAELVKLLEARFAVTSTGCATDIPPLAAPRDEGDAGSQVIYAVGDRVLVVGLVSQTELNGAEATVTRVAGPTGRYGVRVHMNLILGRQASVVEIKGCNLTTCMLRHERVPGTSLGSSSIVSGSSD